MDQPPPLPAPSATGPIAQWERLLPPAVLVLLPSVLIFSAVGSGEMLFGDDVINVFYYQRVVIAQAFREGRLPVWDPHAMAGFPMLAAVQGAVFYPPTWICAFLPAGAFWTLSAWAHLILAGIFAHRWLKRGMGLGVWSALVGAIVFMLSGYIVGHLYAGHVNYVWAYPWIPALFWRLERYLAAPTLKRGTWLAVVLAMLFLAGVPQYVLFAALMVLARSVHFVMSERDARSSRAKAVAHAAAWLALGLLFCTPQLLATLELIPQTQRVSINRYGFVTTFSMPPANLITLLVPGFFGGGGAEVPYWGRGFFWEISGFVGLSGLALAALAPGGRHPQRRLWIGVAATALLLALGRHTPLFRVWFAIVPGADLFRAPGRYLALFTMASSALAAIGFDRWWRDEEGIRHATLRTGIVAGTLLVVALIALPIGGGDSPLWKGILDSAESGPDTSLAEMRKKIPGFDEGSWHEARKSLLIASAALTVLTAALLIHARGAFRGRTGAAVVGITLMLELIVLEGKYLQGFPEKGLAWPPAFTDLLRSAAPSRVASPGMKYLKHVGKCQIAGLDHVGGYEAMLLRNYTELINALSGQPADLATVTATITRPHPALEMLGVRYWIVPRGTPAPPSWKRIATLEDGDAYEAPGAFPRAYLVSSSTTIPDREERLRALAGNAVDLRKTVILEKSAAAAAKEGDLGTCSIASRRPGAYEISAETPSGAFLVLTETDYPGWHAQVDGVPAEILRANHLVQAVWLPPGKHAVRFEYRSMWIGLGFAIAVAAALVPAIVAVVVRRRVSLRIN